MSAAAGKVALVTGGSRGLGLTIAATLAAAGARVALVARREDDLRRAEERIERAIGFPCDVSSTDSVLEHLKRAVEKRLGPPEILVNSAGTYAPMAPVVDSDPVEWIGAVRVNLIGPYLTARTFVPAMAEAGWGRIVNVSSIASLVPPEPLASAYAASKAGVNYLTRSLALELAGTGVTANAIHPGELKTEMWRYIAESAAAAGPEGEEHRAWASEVADTGGDPPEKAAQLVLDCIEDSSINGRFLWIEGGLLGTAPTW